MSGTIVGICTSVLFSHCWGPPLGWVVIPSTAVHVGWLYSTCIFTMTHIIYYTMVHSLLKSNFLLSKDKRNSDRLRKLCANCLGDHPVGLGGYPLCTHVVVYKYRYWVGFAHPVPLSLSLWPAVRGR